MEDQAEETKAGSNIPSKSGMTYLKGDEIVLLPEVYKGKGNKLQTRFVFITVDNAIAESFDDLLKGSPLSSYERNDGIRDAIAIWHPEEFTADNIVKKIRETNTPEWRREYKGRMDALIASYGSSINEQIDNRHIWQPANENAPKPDLNRKRNFFSHCRKSLRAKADSLSHLHRFADIIESDGIIPKVKSHLTVPRSENSDAAYDASVQLLESEQNFSELFKTIFAHHSCPVILSESIGEGNAYAYLMQDGTLISPSYFGSCDSLTDNKDKRHFYTSLSKALIESICLIEPMKAEDLGITSNAVWRDVTREFKEQSRPFMTKEQLASDDAAGHDYSATDIIALTHYYLNFEHIHGFTPEQVREALPLSVAMYDKFMEFTLSKAKEYGYEEPIHQEEPHPVLDEETAPTSPAAEIPPLVPIDLEAELARKTAEVKEKTASFFEEALSAEPPFDQCYVRLNPGSNRGATDHKIYIIMRNENREDIRMTVGSGTSDLLLAQAVKVNLQSHMLSDERVQPLWMSEISPNREGSIKSDEVIPALAPEETKLINNNGFYAAEISFAVNAVEGEGADVRKVQIPLGLKFEKENPEIAEEAESRLATVKNYLSASRNAGRFETANEVAKYLRNTIFAERESDEIGWRTAKSMPVDGYGGTDDKGHRRNIIFDFPANSAQKTRLAGANLRLEDGERGLNSRWRLHLNIVIDGLGDEPVKLNPSINMHTASDIEAQNRAMTMLNSLDYIFKELAKKYPDMKWELSEDGKEILLKNSLERTPIDPDPQNFQHIIDDTEQFHSSYNIIEHKESREHKDGLIYVHIGVAYDHEQDGSFLEFKAPRGAGPLRAKFAIAESEEGKIEDVINSMDETFKLCIMEEFENRARNENGDIVRKHRRGYRPEYIVRLFESALNTEINNGAFASVIKSAPDMDEVDPEITAVDTGRKNGRAQG